MGDWEDMMRVNWTAMTRGRMWGKAKSSEIARGPPRHDWKVFGSLMGFLTLLVRLLKSYLLSWPFQNQVQRICSAFCSRQ